MSLVDGAMVVFVLLMGLMAVCAVANVCVYICKDTRAMLRKKE